MYEIGCKTYIIAPIGLIGLFGKIRFFFLFWSTESQWNIRSTFLSNYWKNVVVLKVNSFIFMLPCFWWQCFYNLRHWLRLRLAQLSNCFRSYIWWTNGYMYSVDWQVSVKCIDYQKQISSDNVLLPYINNNYGELFYTLWCHTPVWCHILA